MLVLSRKRGERIVIGDNIELTVIAIHGQRVQLGVNAPRNVAVRRDELLERSGPEGHWIEGNRSGQEPCE